MFSPVLRVWIVFSLPPLVIAASARRAAADVRITEIHAAADNRHLRWDTGGVPRIGAGAAWWEPGFSVASWATGNAPMGFGFTSPATNLTTALRGVATSLFVRKTFTLTAEEAANPGALRVLVDYNDGHICWINGREAGRSNMGPARQFIFTDQPAYNPARTSTFETRALGAVTSRLVAGENVIAFQIANRDEAFMGNLKFDARLEVVDGPVFVPSGSAWSYFAGPGEPSGGLVDPLIPVPAGDRAEFSDWIELHNDGEAAETLTGWHLSDDPAEPEKWTFPAGTTIPAGGYLVVLADGRNTVTARYAHTNFSLGGEGEYLALFDGSGEMRSGFEPVFPPQEPFRSYGEITGGDGLTGYFENPTPGAANGTAALDAPVEAPVFQTPDAAGPDGMRVIEGGFYTTSQTVTLSCATPGAEIRYTTTGAEPTATTGTVYTVPLTLGTVNNRSGHCVRARAFLAGHVPSRTVTNTFLIAQLAGLRTSPALLMTGDQQRDFFEPYGNMAIQGGTYDANGVWSPSTINDFNQPIFHGHPFERPVFLEWVPGDGTVGFRTEAGMRVSSSPYSRPRLRMTQDLAVPWPADPTQKPSFNLFFRGDYGLGTLDYPIFGERHPVRKFDELRPRAGKNDIQNPFIRDEMIRRMYTQMGHKTSTGILNSLYLNGKLKGYYNTVERYRLPWFQQHHRADYGWDVNYIGVFEEGDAVNWNALITAISRPLSVKANWDAVVARLDVDNYIDYLLLNIYTAMWDWPHNNYVAARERSNEGRWRFYTWDAEGGFGAKPVNFDIIESDLKNAGVAGGIGQIFRAVRAVPEFRQRFADRVNRHFFHGGVLDDRDPDGSTGPLKSRTRVMLDQLAAKFQPLLTAVASQTLDQSFYTTWINVQNGRRAYLFNTDTTTVDVSFKKHGFWPATVAPELSKHGGDVAAGFTVTLTDAAAAGPIYYTLNGADPRETWTGLVSADALTYSSPATLSAPITTVRARVKNTTTGEWSPLTEAEFFVGTAAPSPRNLVVSQIMYHPPDSDDSERAAGITDAEDFEFIEIRNIGAQPVKLAGLRLRQGISFAFEKAPARLLEPGGRLVAVKNRAAFLKRYGAAADARVAGEYDGSLANSGETIELVDDTAGVIRLFAYDDKLPWPESTDGGGFSLLLHSPETAPDHALGASWRASPDFRGAPGGVPAPLTLEMWTALYSVPSGPVELAHDDPDHDGLVNLFEFALGRNPSLADASGALPVPGITEHAGQKYLTVQIRQAASVAPVVLRPAFSGDLQTWSSAPADFVILSEPAPQADGSLIWTVRDAVPLPPSGGRRYFRLIADLNT